jgi:hypothetical protein
LKREARIPSISLNRSVIRMRAYAVRLLRLGRIEFSVHTGHAMEVLKASAIDFARQIDELRCLLVASATKDASRGDK